MTFLFTSCQALLKRIPVTFDYSTLKAHISKTINDRNKWISDSESRHLDGTKQLGRILVVQITYMRKEMRRSTVLFTPYYLKWCSFLEISCLSDVPLRSVAYVVFYDIEITELGLPYKGQIFDSGACWSITDDMVLLYNKTQWNASLCFFHISL